MSNASTGVKLLLRLALIPALALGTAVSGHAADISGRASPAMHVSEFGRYTLHANAISSEFLPATTAKQHGIDQASDRGILNLVILERQGKRQVTVRAKVTASKVNQLGQREEIEMRAIEANGRVSYLGTFGFAPLHNFRFTITVLPAGAGAGEPLKIEFEDRFVVRGR